MDHRQKTINILFGGIERKCQTMFPLIRQLRAVGNLKKAQALAINSVEGGLRGFLGVNVGEAKILFGLGPAEVRAQNLTDGQEKGQEEAAR